MLPKVVDLFSGCGGLTLGFEKAGFEIVAGVELMQEACDTVSNNFDYRYGKDEATHICGDITELEPSIFKDRFGEEGCIVIGGPPCQAYSMAGKGKLRSLGEDRINTNDSRGYLYQDYLRFVYGLNAKVVVMENVPEATNFGDMNIPEIVCDDLERNGYTAFWTILNSADYGVPQTRERLFVFGIKDEGREIKLPVPTHRCITEYNQQYSRRVDNFIDNAHFRVPNSPSQDTKPWVTVGDALSDLPVLFPTANSKYKVPKINEEMEYSQEVQNEYQHQMRTWYNFETRGVTGNCFRNNKRDFCIFEKMEQGANFTDASRIADELFEREALSFGYTVDSQEYEKLKKKMVPIYDRDQFENKWRRLENCKPSHTLVAHLCKDTYSHIHPTEPRGISVREAARLQSFPDDFYFNCSMGDAYKQIGNAVPPLLAYGVAKSILKAYEEK